MKGIIQMTCLLMGCALWIYVCPYPLFQLRKMCVTLFRRLEALGSLPFFLMQSPHDLHPLLDYHQNHISRCFCFVSNCACVPTVVHTKRFMSFPHTSQPSYSHTFSCLFFIDRHTFKRTFTHSNYFMTCRS